MGAGESKGASAMAIMPYKDALARFDAVEVSMIEDAVNKFGDGAGGVDRNTFIRCCLTVLPDKIQHRVYRLFGGTSKGIGLAEIFCGLAVFLKGTVEQRKKFVFALYDAENLGILSKRGVLSALLPGDDRACVDAAFATETEMDYERFDRWMSENPQATGWLEWIMYPAMEHYATARIPTDIDMLTQMTHFSRAEAESLEKRYLQLKRKFQGKGKKLVAASLQQMACPPLTPALLSRLCYLWGERENGELEFREVLFGVSLVCHGHSDEVLDFIFRIFDIGNKKYLAVNDLTAMCATAASLESAGLTSRGSPATSPEDRRTLSLCSITSKQEFEAADEDADHQSDDEVPPPPDGSDPFIADDSFVLTPGLRQAIDKAIDSEGPEGLSQESFKAWAGKNTSFFEGMQKALATVGQAVFALRPRTPAEECTIVQSRMQVDHLRGVTREHGTICNIVAMSWFQSWKEYVGIERPGVGSTGSAGDQNREANLPGQIDNNSLLGRASSSSDSMRSSTRSRTGPGGLRRGLVEDKDYVVLSDTVFSMLHHWYGGGPVIARPIIAHGAEDPKVETYPLSIKVMHHPHSKVQAIDLKQPGTVKVPAISQLLTVECSRAKMVQYLAKLICVKQRTVRKGNPQLKANSVRLWLFDDPNRPRLLDAEDTLAEFHESLTVLLEARNEDLSWPSELFALAKGKRGKFPVETVFGNKHDSEIGVTGLSNLGNTCFMNAALQCTSNTQVLRQYFRRKSYLLEINETNKMGMKGALAKTYAQLVRRLWSGKTSVAPVDMRSMIIKYSSQFAGYQQHDSQELLACLLDGLHEDLNRVHDPPYVERKDSDGRPDHVVATESWEGHMKRSQSIIVDLFQGQLKSRLRCKKCQFESVSFDPFTFLTLPLPTDDTSVVDVTFARLESAPEHCSVRVGRTATLHNVKLELQKLYDCDPAVVIFVEFPGLASERVLDAAQKLRVIKTNMLHAFEIIRMPGLHAVSQNAVGASASAGLATSGSGTEETPVASPSPSPPPSPVLAANEETSVFPGHCFAVHRKQESYRTHFLTDTNHFSVFGTPLLVPCPANCTNNDLYKFVWKRCSYVIEPEFRALVDAGQEEIPFKLAQLSASGAACSKCNWARFCSGCAIAQSNDIYTGNAKIFGIDWNPRELCLHGKTAMDTNMVTHPTVAEIKAKENEPIDIAACLADYTKEEDMGKDDLWYCPKCKEHVEATKKLDIWALPPVLIIHLKRFQMVNARWVKSQRQVTYPLQGFDVFKHISHPKFDATPDNDYRKDAQLGENGADEATPKENGHSSGDAADGGTAVEDIEKLDPHAKFYTDPKCPRVYDLTSMTIHLGIMGGGHYVAYGKNLNDKWYYYNDSSCKVAAEERVERENGYFLFYTARGLDPEAFMPEGTPPPDVDSPEATDNEAADDVAGGSKNCTIS